MNTNCQNCDRADCPTFTMPEESEWQNTREDAAAIEAAIADCEANRVDWRARALTETARADAAEARIAKVIELASKQARLLWDANCDEDLGWKEGQSDAGQEILAALGAEP